MYLLWSSGKSNFSDTYFYSLFPSILCSGPASDYFIRHLLWFFSNRALWWVVLMEKQSQNILICWKSRKVDALHSRSNQINLCCDQLAGHFWNFYTRLNIPYASNYNLLQVHMSIINASTFSLYFQKTQDKAAGSPHRVWGNSTLRGRNRTNCKCKYTPIMRRVVIYRR